MTDAWDRLERKARGLGTFALIAAALGTSAPAVAADGPPPMDAGMSVDEYLRNKNKEATYEFAFVSVAAYQAWAIAGQWLYFGAGGGLGPPLYRYSKLGDNDPGWDPTLEVCYGNLFLRVAAGDYVDVDVGPKIAIVSALFDVKDAPQSGFSYGAYADLRVGSKDIKLGPRFEYDRIAYYDHYDKGWRLTPLMLRVVH